MKSELRRGLSQTPVNVLYGLIHCLRLVGGSGGNSWAVTLGLLGPESDRRRVWWISEKVGVGAGEGRAEPWSTLVSLEGNWSCRGAECPQRQVTTTVVLHTASTAVWGGPDVTPLGLRSSVSLPG